jgi:hypothetical protein
MKRVYLILSIIYSSVPAYSQSVFVLGGMAQTSPNFSYAESSKSFATNVYSVSKLNPSLSVGMEIIQKERYSVSVMIQYNQLSGGIAIDNIGRTAKYSHALMDELVIRQVSLSPLIHLYPIKTKTYQLGFFIGPKLDYILSTNRFVDPYNSFLQNLYDANMKKLVFSSQVGMSFKYKLTPKFGLLGTLSYHSPITEIVNHQEFHLYTSTNPPKTDYVEVANMRTSVRMTQIQLGLTYSLTKKQK